jgi:hypothetical protein
MIKLPGNIEDLDAVELETAWRENADAFTEWFDAIWLERPDSPLLQAWQARLYYNESRPQDDKSRNLLLPTIFISVIAWAIAKLPAYIDLDEQWFYPRFIPWLVIGAMVMWFNLRDGSGRRMLQYSVGALGIVLLYLQFFPWYRNSDSLLMASLHLPMILLTLLGFVFARGHWGSLHARMAFVRYLGELLIFTSLVLLGGGVLTALTLGLFGLVGIRLEEWFFEHVVLWGAMSAPLVATWVWDQVMLRQSRLASIIANVFSPLFLLMTSLYLLVLLGEDRSPFQDREFLIVFNALLLVVWGITVFSIIGRGSKPSTVMDLTNLCLLCVTLIIDGIALAAIVWRLAEYGVSPNRVAVTGANAIIFVHLLMIGWEYQRNYRGMADQLVLQNTIARYLPVYTAWSVIVVLILPVLFGFR